MANDSEKKKDLTGILDLQKLQAEDPNAAIHNEVQDPFAVNELQAIEQVDHFDSIDQIGMMDHPEPVEEAPPAPIEPVETEPAPSEDFPVSAASEDFPVTPSEPNADDQFPVSTDFPTSDASVESPDPFAVQDDQFAVADSSHSADPFAAPADSFTAPADPFAAANNVFAQETTPSEVMPEPETPPAPKSPASNTISNVREYSERTQGKTSLEVKIHYPFHLKITGTFGPYERDKLLMFITENPIGLSSADLDLQITSGRVFLPRISEYAAVKLVQDLRDSGLQFSLTPSDQSADSASVSQDAKALEFHYQGVGASGQSSTLTEIPILSESNPQKSFSEIDQVSIVQYVRTEVMEVENSPMIQEVIERMTESLKQKARLKGGNALFNLKQEILPLRLPSQYQISLKASVVKL